MVQESAESEVMRWYTPARRIQQVIGKPPGGGTYPGGPYTIPQVVSVAVVFVGLSFTRGVWGAPFSWLVSQLIVLACTIGAGFAAKFIKQGGRNPAMAATAAAGAATPKRFGTYQGKAVRAQSTTRARHDRIQVLIPPEPVDTVEATAERRDSAPL